MKNKLTKYIEIFDEHISWCAWFYHKDQNNLLFNITDESNIIKEKFIEWEKSNLLIDLKYKRSTEEGTLHNCNCVICEDNNYVVITYQNKNEL